MSTSNNRPVQEIRLGRVKAAVWENETRSGMRFSVTVQRIYKDGDEWKTSDSFGRDDLPLLAKVLDRVHSYCYDEAGRQNGNESF